MNINAERFFALTALLAAPLVTAAGCVITSSDDDTGGDTGTASMTMSGTDPSASATMTMTNADTDVPGTETGSTTVDPDSTGTGTVDGTGTGTDDTGTGTTGENELGNCCAPEGIVGCEVPEVEECVCALDPYCCEEEWDDSCAMAVNGGECGECEFPPQPLDCFCSAICDGEITEQASQICGADLDAATAAALASCEADPNPECEAFSCDECFCVTSEIPEIDCK